MGARCACCAWLRFKPDLLLPAYPDTRGSDPERKLPGATAMPLLRAPSHEARVMEIPSIPAFVPSPPRSSLPLLTSCPSGGAQSLVQSSVPRDSTFPQELVGVGRKGHGRGGGGDGSGEVEVLLHRRAQITIRILAIVVLFCALVLF
jgi:hypothetical protein